MSTIKTGFKYLEFPSPMHFEEDSATKNYLLFFLKGEFAINCNQYHNRRFGEGEMVLIPRSSVLKVSASGGSLLLSLFFDTPISSCDKLVFQTLAEICKDVKYDFSPLPIRFPLTDYLGILLHCLRSQLNCLHFHELMQCEFFFLLRGFYTKQEIATLFHPIIGKELDFKDFVMQNYSKVNNADELVTLSNMGRSRFYIKFKEVFGMTVKQWMLKQMNGRILGRIVEPGVCIKDIVETFGFDSQAHFNHYCRQHFGCTPKQLIDQYHVVNK